MRLRTLFLICFAIASLPALIWSAQTALKSRAEWSTARAGVRAAGAMGDALRLVEALSVERGALQERALSDGSGVEDLGAIAAANDALLDRTQASLRAARLPDEAVTQARRILLVARRRVAEAVRLPRAERDPGLIPDLMAQLYTRLADVEEAVAAAEAATAQADARIGQLVEVASLAVEMRDAAGKRSSHLSGWFGGRKLTPEQIRDLTLLTGRIQQAWDRLRHQVAVVGKPERLVAAVTATRDGFFRESEPVYLRYGLLAAAGDPRPLSLAEWRRWTIAALVGVLPARDAAVAEAVAFGERLESDASARFVGALSAMAGALALNLLGLVVLLRRLVLPIQQLTVAVSLLAAGQVRAKVPGFGRRDEIGAMSAALEVFRANALALEQTNVRFSAALENMMQGLAMFDGDERLAVFNRRFCDVLCLPPDRVQLGMAYNNVIELSVEAGNYPGRTAEQVCRERRAGMARREEVSHFDIANEQRAVAVRYQSMQGGGWVVTFEDVTERRKAEALIAHMAHHDALTELPNRVQLREHINRLLARLHRAPGGFALLYLDLDGFKGVNDTFGHPVGDELLGLVAQRLRAAVRESDLVARLGGDEFAVIQDSAEQPADSAALSERLVEAFREPFELQAHSVEIGVSIGVALVAPDCASAADLLRNADIALYRAKAAGKGTWRLFKSAMDEELQRRRALGADLRRALAEEQFALAYQPVVNAESGLLTGFEALLRWRNPERGVVSPGEFMPIAEEAGLIGPIGAWVLARACSDAASWPSDLKLAVNLSPRQFIGRDLGRDVEQALLAARLAPQRLELEITETVLLQDNETTLGLLHRLRDLGVAISMDDFGTGYSSLSYLRRFPFDKIKVDQSFIASLEQDPSGLEIVRAVISLTKALGMKVLAEGVENMAQAEILRREGCDELQGYLFSSPVSVSEVRRVIETRCERWTTWRSGSCISLLAG